MAALEEDDIDIETLQAQIDMSMAFAQDLVSSWVQPSRASGSASQSSRRYKDAEKELEELLRRPPRLGVGAPLLESTHPSGREAVKLKNKLVGKKRAREDEDGGSTSLEGKAKLKTVDGEDEEDEEESRAGAIRKKVKVDPFAIGGKKKGKGKGKGNETVFSVAGPSQKKAKVDHNGRGAEEEVGRQGEEMEVDDEKQGGETPKNEAGSRQAQAVTGASQSEQSKKKRKKQKKRMAVALHELSSTEVQKSDAMSEKSSEATSSSPPKPAFKDIPTLQSEPRPSLQPTPSKAPLPQTPKSDSKATQSTHAQLVALNIPVLNLTGPPPDTAASEEPDASPKKKRKRKKKKKRAVAGEEHVEGADDVEQEVDA
ncbi:hypothetical protein EW146_g1365 [Bondarzewia mesenterica]|uniref:Uncharacterized protein n=1 Tax=Bondarzewia mesenterica TaxID=1095465 RepID=A0A4S4M448_9AGAM|nr:hypothetical protein EW146_g1365 [Bondarzewia mesenterica]